jgi:hypothetical protein
MILFDRSARANQVAIIGPDVLFFAPVTQSFDNELHYEYHVHTANPEHTIYFGEVKCEIAALK